jgi:hypothetical protein
MILKNIFDSKRRPKPLAVRDNFVVEVITFFVMNTMQSESSLITNIGWRIPNSVFIVLSWLVVALTWTMLLYVYPSLPSTIPTHFGFSGLADAASAKSVGNVFLPALLQLILVSLTWWLSHYPQYSHLPTGLMMNLLTEPTKGLVKRLLSHLLVMTGLVASLIMAYISLGIIRVSLGLTDRLNNFAVLGLVGLLLLIIAVYSIWLVKLTRHLPPPISPPITK